MVSNSRSWQDRGRASQNGQQELEGMVAEVNYLPGATAERAMVEIRLVVGVETVLIRLGPWDCLKANQAAVREGDTVQVTGYWVGCCDGQMLVATQLTLHGRTVRLRDSGGRPSW
jgi:hypothetical protein